MVNSDNTKDKDSKTGDNKMVDDKSSSALSHVKSLSLEEVLKSIADTETLGDENPQTHFRDGLQDDRDESADGFTRLDIGQLGTFAEYRRVFGDSPPPHDTIFADMCEPQCKGFDRPNPTLDVYGSVIRSSEIQYATIILGFLPTDGNKVPIAFTETWLLRHESDESLVKAETFMTWVVSPRTKVPQWIMDTRPSSTNRIFVVDSKRPAPIEPYNSLDAKRSNIGSAFSPEDPHANVSPLQTSGRHTFLAQENMSSQGSPGTPGLAATNLFGTPQPSARSDSCHPMRRPVNSKFGNCCDSLGSGGYIQSKNSVDKSLIPVAPVGKQMDSDDLFLGGNDSSKTSKTDFGRFSTNPEHAKKFAANPQSVIGLPPGARSNLLVPNFQTPGNPQISSATGIALGIGQQSTSKDPRRMFPCGDPDDPKPFPQSQQHNAGGFLGSNGFGRPSGQPGVSGPFGSARYSGSPGSSGFTHQSTVNANPFHQGMNEFPRSYWQDGDDFYGMIAAQNRNGERIVISPERSNIKEAHFNFLLVPASDECYFSRKTLLRWVHLPSDYTPRGSVYSYLSKSDLVRLFHTSEDETSWSKTFFILEEVMPNPPRSASEMARIKMDGKICDPYWAMVLSCNAFPSELMDKIDRLIAHFDKRTEKCSELSNSDDDRYVEYCLRRMEKARTYVGSACNGWLDQSAFIRFVRTLQIKHQTITVKQFCACFVDVADDQYKTSWIKTCAFMLGLCPWRRVESINREVTRALCSVHSPQNVLKSFTDVLSNYVELNPSLDESSQPLSSRGQPLTLGIEKIRPDQECCTGGVDFIAYFSTNFRNANRDNAYEYNTAKKQNENLNGNPNGEKKQIQIQNPPGTKNLMKKLNQMIGQAQQKPNQHKANPNEGANNLGKKEINDLIKAQLGSAQKAANLAGKVKKQNAGKKKKQPKNNKK
jgi:hypothetical protein